MSDESGNNPILDSATFNALRPILGQIAHDFNNLLTPLLAYPALIRMHLSPDADAGDLIDAIEKAAQDMIHINEQLMLLSSKGTPETTPVDITNLLEGLIDSITPEPGAQAVSVLREIPEGLPKINISIEHFCKAFDAVFTNAIESRKEGDIKIRISAHAERLTHDSALRNKVPAGEYVKLCIEDNGLGLSQEMLTRAFVPFATSKKALKRRGSGLGLSIAFVICRDHGGFIEVKNRPGGGASVSMYFPAVIPQSEKAQTGGIDKSSKQKEGLLPKSNNRILLVDDEKTILKLFGMIISGAIPECTIDTASNGQEALDLYRKHHHGVIVMDLHMPVMDGQTAFLEIDRISVDQGWEQPAVVFCTGFAPPDIVNRVVSGDTTHCILSKPVRGEVLVDAIKHRMAL